MICSTLASDTTFVFLYIWRHKSINCLVSTTHYKLNYSCQVNTISHCTSWDLVTTLQEIPSNLGTIFWKNACILNIALDNAHCSAMWVQLQNLNHFHCEKKHGTTLLPVNFDRVVSLVPQFFAMKIAQILHTYCWAPSKSMLRIQAFLQKMWPG